MSEPQPTTERSVFTLFYRVTRNHRATMDGEPVTVLPGTCLNLSQVSKSTIYRWKKRGWIKDCGLFVLTTKGYREAVLLSQMHKKHPME